MHLHHVGKRGVIFEKYVDDGGVTQFGWLDATITAVHANGYLTVNTSAGAYVVEEKEFVV